MYDIHFVTLPNGEIVKVDIGGYVDTDTVREMTPDECTYYGIKYFAST